MAYSSSNPPVKEINILSVQGCVSRMWHNACFLLVLSGEVQVTVDEHATYLNDNGILLVEPDTPFELSGHGSNLLMIIRMDYDFYAQSRSGRFGKLVCNSAEDDQRDYSLLRQMLSHLAMNYFENAECKALRQLELCYSLLYYLNTMHYQPGETALSQGREGELNGRMIVSYIESNYMQDIRLDDLSEAAFLSPSYLSRLFKKLTGTNFKAYLEEVRLRHAVEDMRNTDLTITAIAYNNGFPTSVRSATPSAKNTTCRPTSFGNRSPCSSPSHSSPRPMKRLPMRRYAKIWKISPARNRSRRSVCTVSRTIWSTRWRTSLPPCRFSRSGNR